MDLHLINIEQRREPRKTKRSLMAKAIKYVIKKIPPAYKLR